MKVLYLTAIAMGDRSFGAAVRSDDLRLALAACSEVDTLIIRGGPNAAVTPVTAGNRVSVITLSTHALSPRGLAERWAAIRSVARVIATGKYDLIVARNIGLASFVPLSRWRDLVIDEDDIVVSTAAGTWSRGERVKKFVRNRVVGLLTRFPRHIWHANPLHRDRFVARSKSVLPNTVVVPPPMMPAPVQPPRILMVGLFAYGPNREGLRWFAERVLPSIAARVSGVELHAVGRSDTRVIVPSSNMVNERGFVNDLSTEYRAASLVVAPVIAGGGTQIKVIEALMYARPLVASRFAHAAFADHFVDGEHLRVADDADAWIEACCAVLEQPAQAEAMAVRGRAAAIAHYSRDRFNAAVAETLDRLSDRKRAS